jgi:hypothetical protein
MHCPALRPSWQTQTCYSLALESIIPANDCPVVGCFEVWPDEESGAWIFFFLGVGGAADPESNGSEPHPKLSSRAHPNAVIPSAVADSRKRISYGVEGPASASATITPPGISTTHKYAQLCALRREGRHRCTPKSCPSRTTASGTLQLIPSANPNHRPKMDAPPFPRLCGTGSGGSFDSHEV